MANVKYNSFGRALAKNDIDTVTIKAMFVNPSYTPNPDTEVYLSDIVSNRASGSTDVTLSGLNILLNNTDNATDFDFTDITSATGTFTTDGIVLYIDTGVEATSELLCFLDLLSAGVPTTFSVIAGVLTGTVNTRGLFSI